MARCIPRRVWCASMGGARESMINSAEAMAKARARRVSSVALPVRVQSMRQLAVHAMIFLETRPFSMYVGQCDTRLSLLTLN